MESWVFHVLAIVNSAAMDNFVCVFCTYVYNFYIYWTGNSLVTVTYFFNFWRNGKFVLCFFIYSLSMDLPVFFEGCAGVEWWMVERCIIHLGQDCQSHCSPLTALVMLKSSHVDSSISFHSSSFSHFWQWH
jgi:hypothetical protein